MDSSTEYFIGRAATIKRAWEKAILDISVVPSANVALANDTVEFLERVSHMTPIGVRIDKHSDGSGVKSGYHACTCPECSYEFELYCDKRQTSEGRIGRPSHITENHASIMNIFEKNPESWYTAKQIQANLNFGQIKHIGRSFAWAIDVVTDPISDLQGKGFLEGKRAAKGREKIYKLLKPLPHELIGTTIS